jgi:hypothetical protein
MPDITYANQSTVQSGYRKSLKVISNVFPSFSSVLQQCTGLCTTSNGSHLPKKFISRREKSHNHEFTTDREPNFLQLLRVHQQPSIKHKCRLVHILVHRLPIDLAELFPFSSDDNRLCVLACLQRRRADRDLLLDYRDDNNVQCSIRDAENITY